MTKCKDGSSADSMTVDQPSRRSALVVKVHGHQFWRDQAILPAFDRPITARFLCLFYHLHISRTDLAKLTLSIDLGFIYELQTDPPFRHASLKHESHPTSSHARSDAATPISTAASARKGLQYTTEGTRSHHLQRCALGGDHAVVS